MAINGKIKRTSSDWRVADEGVVGVEGTILDPGNIFRALHHHLAFRVSPDTHTGNYFYSPDL